MWSSSSCSRHRHVRSCHTLLMFKKSPSITKGADKGQRKKTGQALALCHRLFALLETFLNINAYQLAQVSVLLNTTTYYTKTCWSTRWRFANPQTILVSLQYYSHNMIATVRGICTTFSYHSSYTGHPRLTAQRGTPNAYTVASWWWLYNVVYQWQERGTTLNRFGMQHCCPTISINAFRFL